MQVIKPPFGPVRSAIARCGKSASRARLAHWDERSARPSVDVSTLMAGLEAERRHRVEDLKRAIKSGTYRPNFQTVAERLLGELAQ